MPISNRASASGAAPGTTTSSTHSPSGSCTSAADFAPACDVVGVKLGAGKRCAVKRCPTDASLAKKNVNKRTPAASAMPDVFAGDGATGNNFTSDAPTG